VDSNMMASTGQAQSTPQAAQWRRYEAACRAGLDQLSPQDAVVRAGAYQ
jgi:hypothetical protein